MHDYNGDGACNGHDAAIFHNVINSSGGGGGGGGTGGGGVSGGLGGVIIALIVMEIFKPGRIFDGGFACVVWLICAGYLLLRFIGWLGSL